MLQPDTARFKGNWKALFIGPDPRVRRELGPLLARVIPALAACELNLYPARQQLVAALASQAPNLCFLDAASERETALALIPEIQRVAPKLPIVAVIPANDSNLIMRCLRLGASDFLVDPFTHEQVEAALEKVARQQPAAAGATVPGRVICVMPAKGGCGATTVASSLAYQWKRLGLKRVLLADLDPLAGTLSFLLKIKSQYSFLDVLHRSSDIDADLWKAMVTNRQGVDVLLSPEMMVEGLNELNDAASIIEYARQNYDVVVLDANGVYGEWNLSQAQLCDDIILVTTNELTSLQGVQRAFSYLDSNGVGRWKIRLIVNRYDKQVGLGKDVIGTALHTEVYYFIPSDYDAVQKALMEGKPIPPSSTFGKNMIGLADRLAGREETAKKGSSLAGLLSLFSRTS
jgi:pilus assembly protein CpaE